MLSYDIHQWAGIPLAEYRSIRYNTIVHKRCIAPTLSKENASMRKAHGFTLIELLVVIAIIAIPKLAAPPLD